MASLQYPALARASSRFPVELDRRNYPGQIDSVKTGRTNAGTGLLVRYLLQRRREWKKSLFAGALALASITFWLYFISQLS